MRLDDLVFLRRLVVAELALQIKSFREPEDSSSLYKWVTEIYFLPNEELILFLEYRYLLI